MCIQSLHERYGWKVLQIILKKYSTRWYFPFAMHPFNDITTWSLFWPLVPTPTGIKVKCSEYRSLTSQWMKNSTNSNYWSFKVPYLLLIWYVKNPKSLPYKYLAQNTHHSITTSWNYHFLNCNTHLQYHIKGASHLEWWKSTSNHLRYALHYQLQHNHGVDRKRLWIQLIERYQRWRGYGIDNCDCCWLEL